jgi:Mrp family chromosome partitioning ATPase
MSFQHRKFLAYIQQVGRVQLNLFRRRATRAAESANFDLLRVRLEQEVALPSVIALTSATPEDGKEIVARGLAHSLAICGYSTLFIDTALAERTVPMLPRGLAIEEIGRRQSPADAATGRLAVLTLDDVTLQRTTSLRAMNATLDILRSNFDYVVISTEFGMSTAFGTAVTAGADAVLVSVKTGRRETKNDDGLASALDRIGPRFLGVVALTPSIIDANSAAPVPKALPSSSRRRTAPAWITRFARVVNAAGL